MIVTRETMKYVEKMLPYCYCRYHKSHKQWPGISLRRNSKLSLFCFRSVHVGRSSQNSPISKFVSDLPRWGCQTYGTRHSMPSQFSDQRLYTVKNKCICTHTGCPRRNVPDLGRVFLMLKYTDITQNTYVQSWTVTEIMAREKCGLLAGPRTLPVS